MYLDGFYILMLMVGVIGLFFGLALLAFNKEKGFGTIMLILSILLLVGGGGLSANSYNYFVTGTITDKTVLQNNNAIKLDDTWYFTEDANIYLYIAVGDNVIIDVFERPTSTGSIKQIKSIIQR
jgi:hypothetical protein